MQEGDAEEEAEEKPLLPREFRPLMLPPWWWW